MIITMLFCKDHIDGDDNNSDGGVNDDGDGDYNVDVVDKVKPQLAVDRMKSECRQNEVRM